MAQKHFKIGDRVIARKVNTNKGFKRAEGLTGTVINTCTSKPTQQLLIEFDEPLAFGDDGGWFSGDDGEEKRGKPGHCIMLEINDGRTSDEIDLYEDGKQPKYKIGDKVIVATSNIDSGGKCKYENEVGTIRSIDETYEYPYGVVGTSYGGTLWVTVKGLVEDKKEERKKGEFRPGDRVRVFATVGKKNVKNVVGTLIGNQQGMTNSWLIEFDDNIKGHDGNGIKGVDGKELTCKEGHGWYVFNELFKLLGEGDFDFSIETDVYTPKPVKVVVLSFSYEELFKLRFAYRQGFVFAAKMNNELWFFKEDPHYPTAFRIVEVI